MVSYPDDLEVAAADYKKAKAAVEDARARVAESLLLHQMRSGLNQSKLAELTGFSQTWVS
ncbi:unnamed protein product, partial [marine sediment metagenome]